VILQTKIYDHHQLQQVESSLKAMLEGLNVTIGGLTTTQRGWVGLSVSGEDEKVALKYLSDNVGFCPSRLDDIAKFSSFKGYLVGPFKAKDELKVDLGIVSPADVDAAISLRRLQAQLCDGRKIALGKFVEVFGFCERLPLHVKVVNVDLDVRHVEVELSESQRMQYVGWARSLLDRLLVLGASIGEVEAAVKAAGFGRDVVGVDSLGMFEHVVVCKLGTDAVGLVRGVGRLLRRSVLSVFNARKIVGLLGSGFLG
jgi:hypothetical protein